MIRFFFYSKDCHRWASLASMLITHNFLVILIYGSKIVYVYMDWRIRISTFQNWTSNFSFFFFLFFFFFTTTTIFFLHYHFYIPRFLRQNDCPLPSDPHRNDVPPIESATTKSSFVGRREREEESPRWKGEMKEKKKNEKRWKWEQGVEGEA